MYYCTDNAFHDCSAQGLLCSHTALSPRNQELRITLVHPGHSRQLGKWPFSSGWKKHELIAVISFLTHSEGRLMTMFFPSQMPACLQLQKLYVLHCALVLPPDVGLHPDCWRSMFCHWVETNLLPCECENLIYQEYSRQRDFVFLFFCCFLLMLLMIFLLCFVFPQLARSHTK